MRILNGDTVKVIRGEFKGVDGKVVKVSTAKHTIAIEGIKKQKRKGDKIDVYIDSSNVVITNLNTDDKWRTARLEKKPKEKIKTEKAENETETKPTKKKESKKSDPKIKTEKAKNKTETKPTKKKESKK